MTTNDLLRAAWDAGWNAANPEAADVPASFEEWLPAYEAMMKDETAERIAQLQYEAGMYRSLYENATPPPAPQGEAVAWLHSLHMELDQTERVLTFTDENPFGKPGKDYSAEYKVTSAPLYLHPTPPAMDGGLSFVEQRSAYIGACRAASDNGSIYDGKRWLDALHASGFEIRRKI